MSITSPLPATFMNTADQVEVIVNDHYEPLFRFAMSLTRSESEALELTQQTLSVWAAEGQRLRDTSQVKTWLFMTLHRAFQFARRGQSRFTRQPGEAIAGELPPTPPASTDPMDSSQVLSALAKVDEVNQAAVALFYLEDLSDKEIATILEIPADTVKSRIARGIAQLKNILLPDGSGASSNIAVADESVSPPGNSFPHRRQHIRIATWVAESFSL